VREIKSDMRQGFERLEQRLERIERSERVDRADKKSTPY
jgi:hypothetical protein